MKKYDVIIVGAGPGGIFSAYELVTNNSEIKVAVFEKGHLLEKRKCPIDGDKVKKCISCKTCSIMSGFGGAGAFSDGKYNITNDFGGTLYEYIGKKKAIELMEYVDKINMKFGGEGTKLYSTAGTSFKKLCLQNKLNLLDASVRHLGTDINYIVLKNLYDYLENKVDFYFDTPVENVELKNGNDKEGYLVDTADENYECKKCIVSVAEAAASGWNMFVITLTFPQSRTVLTSVFVWSSLPQSFHTSQTNSTKARLFTAQNSSRTMCVHSA